MMIIVDHLTGETVGWLFGVPAQRRPVDPVDALASKVTFGRDSAATREAREFAAWEDELDAWLDAELPLSDPIRDVFWPEED